MSVDTEQRVRERAYAIWLEEGCPEGRDTEHWLQAERAIAADAGALPDLAPVAAEVTALRKTTARTVAESKAVSAKTVGRPRSVKTEEPVVAAEPPKARKPRVRKTVTA